AEDGIRDSSVTGVQTCALPILAADAIVLDPGLGFAKRPEHSYAALKALPEFAALGRPLLVGPSRKSFLTAAIGERGVDDREFATAASVAPAVLLGARLVRDGHVRAILDWCCIS